MVSIVQRMRKLKTLLAVRIGPGAAILPKDVKRLHLDFATKMNDGHMGPRKFWRHCLPRLKYHNPAIPMTVSRDTDQSGDATLTVFFAHSPLTDMNASPAKDTIPTSSTSSSTSPSSHVPADRIQTISMKNRTDLQIMAELVKLTGAKELQPTPEELETLRELEAQRERSMRDSARHAEVNIARKREADLLKQARGELGLAQS